MERKILDWLKQKPSVPKPPPIRSDFMTWPRAQRILAENPKWLSSYKGDLQMHSTWSDGSGSISDMAQAAIQRDYQYIAITDHSKGLKIAGGINEAELAQQRLEIDKVNEQLAASDRSFRVLHSVELNLNPLGGGDMDSSALRKLDLVVGSFHSALRKVTHQTERYLAALRNPDVHILGHPQGRIYNHRLGLQADWRRVFGMAASLDKAVEVDAYPDRQDLSLPLLKIAKQEGVRIAIDTDAHSPPQLAFAELGLAAALDAGIPADRIINFMSLSDLLAWCNRS
jgi:histidinol phosphatase-like PHP family hydrolase